jgi:hypothetical protein
MNLIPMMGMEMEMTITLYGDMCGCQTTVKNSPYLLTRFLNHSIIIPWFNHSIFYISIIQTCLATTVFSHEQF